MIKNNFNCKPIWAIFLLLVVLTLSPISAWDFDNVKEYYPKTETIEIINALGLGDTLAEYKLTSNTYSCLINCKAEGIAELYEEGELFTDLNFKDKDGDLTNIQYNKISIEINESYEIEITDYGEPICETLNANGTDYQSCQQNLTGTHNETRYNVYWDEYNYETKSAGTYKWKIEGKKGIYESVDWIGSAFGEDFTEWAWWDTDYLYKVKVNVTESGLMDRNVTAGGLGWLVNASLTFLDDRINSSKEIAITNCDEDTELEFGYLTTATNGDNITGVDLYFRLDENVTKSETGCVYVYYDCDSCGDHSFTYNYSNMQLISETGTGTEYGEYLPWYNYATSDHDIIPSNPATEGNPDRWFKFTRPASSGYGYYAFHKQFTPTNPKVKAIFDANTTTLGGAPANHQVGLILINGTENNGTIGSTSTAPFTICSDITFSNARLNCTLDITIDLAWTTFGIMPFSNITPYNNLTVMLAGKAFNDGAYISYSGWDNINIIEEFDGTIVQGAEISSLGVTTNLISPSDNNISTNLTTTFIAQSVINIGGITFDNVTLAIWNSSIDLIIENKTDLSGNVTVETNWTFTLPYDGVYTWNALTSADNGAQKDWGINRTLTIDTTLPQINIDNPTGIINIISTNVSLNYSAVDANLDSCWYSHDSGVTNISLPSCANVSIEFPVVGNNTVDVWANDSAGNIGIGTSNYYTFPLFAFCNSTLNLPYLNISFRNETISQENVSAAFSSTFTYYFDIAHINSTFTFTNVSENPSYQFCTYPNFTSLTAGYKIIYSNSESQQRIFNGLSLLTNTTTNKVLYLLPTSLGLFSPFQVVDNNADPISNAVGTITRIIGGETITVAIDSTDSSGFVSFFLNPSFTYSALFSATGYTDESFTFVPTTDFRTVIMGTAAGAISNGTSIMTNTSYNIIPLNSTLNNNTDILFGFNVTSGQPIIQIAMNITNSTGTQLGFQNSSTAGFLSELINTGDNSQIIGTFLIQTSTESITFQRIWFIEAEFIGSYSMFRQMTLFNDYNFKSFWKLLIILSTIAGLIIFMSANEIIETSESKIWVITLTVWAFSKVSWLSTGLNVNSSSQNINTLAQFSSQYGIAILVTFVALFFTMRRIFIRRP